MAAKDPHLVLGVQHGATPEEIKAAWRRLARRHHPDLTGDDPEAARRATTRMAEINAAYAALTRAGETPEGVARRAGPPARPPAGRRAPAGGGPPPAPPTRPVTGRLDLSHTVRPRNQVLSRSGAPVARAGTTPPRAERAGLGLRASEPAGPVHRDRVAGHVAPEPPPLAEALAVEMPFGKFHGHTLGEIARFEPAYIDWLASSLVRDPELALAARAIAAELDRRGVRRARRPVQRSPHAGLFD